MTNAELMVLLAELRGRMATYGDAYAMRIIDAALAEPLDSDTPVVEWCMVRDTWSTAYPVDGVEMTVMRWADGSWKWWTKRESSAQGTASTEEEAKKASIGAARKMK